MVIVLIQFRYCFCQGIIEYNAFSPNGDNVNDNFSFENCGISDLNAVFYNRWGDKIYEMKVHQIHGMVFQ